MAEFKDVTVKRWVCEEPGCDDYFDDEVYAQIHEARHEAERCQHPNRGFEIAHTKGSLNIWQRCRDCGAEGFTGYRLLDGGSERYERESAAVVQAMWDEVGREPGYPPVEAIDVEGHES